jgi:catechol 2,3-dioxygenase-like lactoylglutathione lyase family enzyme
MLKLMTDAGTQLEFGIQVSDPEASLRFYRDTLGLELYGETDRPNRHMWGLRAGDCLIKLVYDKNETLPSNPRSNPGDSGRVIGMFLLTFRVDNGEEMTNACAAAGYEVPIPWEPVPADLARPTKGGHGIVRDPDGNLVSFTDTDAFWMPANAPQ